MNGVNRLRLFHGPPCKDDHCLATKGELLIETWNRGLASVMLGIQAAESRVADPGDHAGSWRAEGPDVREAYARLTSNRERDDT